MELPALVELTCQEAVERIADYLEDTGGLAAASREVLEEHLYACPWCMTFLQQLRAISGAARCLDPDAQPRGVHATAATASGSGPRDEPGQPRFAFKFLARGALAPIAGCAWPLPAHTAPGAWLSVDRSLMPCRVGLHVTPRASLARWLHDELWLVELKGAQQVRDHQRIVSAARLVRRIEAWDAPLQRAFMEAALHHAHATVSACGEHAAACAAPQLASAERHIARGNVALSAYGAAMAVARGTGGPGYLQAGYDEARAFQSGWLSRELGLDALAGAA